MTDAAKKAFDVADACKGCQADPWDQCGTENPNDFSAHARNCGDSAKNIKNAGPFKCAQYQRPGVDVNWDAGELLWTKYVMQCSRFGWSLCIHDDEGTLKLTLTSPGCLQAMLVRLFQM